MWLTATLSSGGSTGGLSVDEEEREINKTRARSDVLLSEKQCCMKETL